MPWWSWILIWIALIALSLLFYVLLGIRLYRQFMAVMKDLGAAGAKVAHLAPAAAIGDDGSQPPGSAPPGAAVFASPAQMRHDYDASKSSRREDRRQRRIQRRCDRGQPQSLRDLNLS